MSPFLGISRVHARKSFRSDPHLVVSHRMHPFYKDVSQITILRTDIRGFIPSWEGKVVALAFQNTVSAKWLAMRCHAVFALRR